MKQNKKLWLKKKIYSILEKLNSNQIQIWSKISFDQIWFKSDQKSVLIRFDQVLFFFVFFWVLKKNCFLKKIFKNNECLEKHYIVFNLRFNSFYHSHSLWSQISIFIVTKCIYNLFIYLFHYLFICLFIVYVFIYLFIRNAFAHMYIYIVPIWYNFSPCTITNFIETIWTTANTNYRIHITVLDQHVFC